LFNNEPDGSKQGIGHWRIMSNYAHETASTKHLDVEGTRYAYRRFGKTGNIPILFLGYFNSNMDAWDPILTNSLAQAHDLILLDGAGVGDSEGRTPSTVAEMAEHCFAFCRGLGLEEVNILGFSLGGMIAQQMGLEHPALVKRLILLGTGPRGGEGMTFTELSAEEQTDPVAFLLGAFFTPSVASQDAGRQYLNRIQSRGDNRALPVSRVSAQAQLDAIREWGVIPKTERFAYLKKIAQPVLIIHGNKDIVVTPINALLLAENLPDATLIVYSDSSHGAQSQHAELFLEHAKLFLNGGDQCSQKLNNSERL
jgi:pimeloyl-ACP methyl ester carboxylesterase